MANFHARMMNIQGRPASMIAGSAQSWNEGHRHARHEAAQIALEADTRIEQLEAQVRAADALAVGPVVVMKFLDCVFTFKDRNEALRFSKRLRDELGETISDHCEYDVSSCDSAFEAALEAYRATKEGTDQ